MCLLDEDPEFYVIMGLKCDCKECFNTSSDLDEDSGPR